MTERMILDPSVFFDGGTRAIVEQMLDGGEEVLVPESFAAAIDRPEAWATIVDAFRPSPDSEWARVRQRDVADPTDTQRWLDRVEGSLERYSANPDSDEVGRAYFVLLRQVAGDDLLASVLFEEWRFLMTESLMGSLSRWCTDRLTDAGTVVVGVTRPVGESMIRSARKLPADKPISRKDALIGTVKWVAAGGAAIAGFGEEVVSLVADAGGTFGVLTLFDP